MGVIPCLLYKLQKERKKERERSGKETLELFVIFAEADGQQIPALHFS